MLKENMSNDLKRFSFLKETYDDVLRSSIFILATYYLVFT